MSPLLNEMKCQGSRTSFMNFTDLAAWLALNEGRVATEK